MINWKLLQNRKIDNRTAYDIANAQAERDNLILYIMNTDVSDTQMLRYYNQKLIDNEFDLQELWGLDKDAKHHNLVGLGVIPHCTCPCNDNQYLVGVTSDRIYSEDCPIHGGVK